MSANRIAPDGMPRFASSYLGLFCLPVSHKKDARLIWVNYKCLKHIIYLQLHVHTKNETHHFCDKLVHHHSVLYPANFSEKTEEHI